MTVDANKTFSIERMSRVCTFLLLGISRPQLHYRDLDVDEYQEEYFLTFAINQAEKLM